MVFFQPNGSQFAFAYDLPTTADISKFGLSYDHQYLLVFDFGKVLTTYALGPEGPDKIDSFKSNYAIDIAISRNN